MRFFQFVGILAAIAGIEAQPVEKGAQIVIGISNEGSVPDRQDEGYGVGFDLTAGYA